MSLDAGDGRQGAPGDSADGHVTWVGDGTQTGLGGTLTTWWTEHS